MGFNHQQWDHNRENMTMRIKCPVIHIQCHVNSNIMGIKIPKKFDDPQELGIYHPTFNHLTDLRPFEPTTCDCGRYTSLVSYIRPGAGPVLPGQVHTDQIVARQSILGTSPS